MIDPKIKRRGWHSSWEVVEELLGARAGTRYIQNIGGYYTLCVDACNAGILVTGNLWTWQLAPGVTKKRARVVLKALALSKARTS